MEQRHQPLPPSPGGAGHAFDAFSSNQYPRMTRFGNSLRKDQADPLKSAGDRCGSTVARLASPYGLAIASKGGTRQSRELGPRAASKTPEPAETKTVHQGSTAPRRISVPKFGRSDATG